MIETVRGLVKLNPGFGVNFLTATYSTLQKYPPVTLYKCTMVNFGIWGNRNSKNVMYLEGVARVVHDIRGCKFPQIPQ